MLKTLVTLVRRDDPFYGKTKSSKSKTLSMTGNAAIDTPEMTYMPLLDEDNGDEHWLALPNVSAIGSVGSKRREVVYSAPVVSPWAPCGGRKHPPEACCICSQPHIVCRCWQVVGLPDMREQRRRDFATLYERREGPWSSTPPSPAAPSKDVAKNTRFASTSAISEHPSSSTLSDHAKEDSDDAKDEMLQKQLAYQSNLVHQSTEVNAALHGVTLSIHGPYFQPDCDSATSGSVSVTSDVCSDDLSLSLEHPVSPDVSLIGYVVSVAEADEASHTEWALADRSTTDDNMSEAATKPSLDDDDIQLPPSVMVVPPKSPPVGSVWFHVDTGAMSACVTSPDDLQTGIPVTATCGTAKKGAESRVSAVGMAVLEFGSDTLKPLHFTMDGIMAIKDFQQRSLSLHALKLCGYETDHCLREHGNYLWLCRFGDKTEHLFPLTTAHGTDFIAVRMNPGPENVASCGAPNVSVILDLAKKLKDYLQFALLHL